MPTPPPPPTGFYYELGSSTILLVDRTFSAGELLIGLAVLAVAALIGLQWAAQLTRPPGK